MTIKAGETDNMTFRKLFMLSVMVGLTETLQALAIIPFLGLISTILDGQEFNANFTTFLIN